MKKLKTDLIFNEADQAMYTKALDVMFTLKYKGEDLFPTKIPYMGGFHIGLCMLRTAPFFSSLWWNGDRKETINRWSCQRRY